jgi:hypothetical protein
MCHNKRILHVHLQKTITGSMSSLGHRLNNFSYRTQFVLKSYLTHYLNLWLSTTSWDHGVTSLVNCLFPDGVVCIFVCHGSLGTTLSLGSTETLTEMIAWKFS